MIRKKVSLRFGERPPTISRPSLKRWTFRNRPNNLSLPSQTLALDQRSEKKVPLRFVERPRRSGLGDFPHSPSKRSEKKVPLRFGERPPTISWPSKKTAVSPSAGEGPRFFAPYFLTLEVGCRTGTKSSSERTCARGEPRTPRSCAPTGGRRSCTARSRMAGCRRNASPSSTGSRPGSCARSRRACSHTAASATRARVSGRVGRPAAEPRSGVVDRALPLHRLRQRVAGHARCRVLHIRREPG